MRYAVIEDGKVVNVILAADGFEIEGQELVASDVAGIGWTYDGDDFAPAVIPIEDRKAAMQESVGEKLVTILASGYEHDFGPPNGAKLLQTRNNTDRINWLTSQAAYSAAVISGAGSIMGANFRTADNTDITLSYADGLNVLLAMAGWGASVYAASWALKNAIDAAADNAALDAIDIEAGWPE